MDLLTPIELRVLGTLLEKKLSTPDYYPMTLNALKNGGNQKSSRDPVLSLDESTIKNNLLRLREKKFALEVVSDDQRVPKFKETFTREYELDKPAQAIISVLMLRGPQTVGEIRSRTNRLYEFTDLQDVETELNQLIDRNPEPLISQLKREPGRKESRYYITFSDKNLEDAPDDEIHKVPVSDSYHKIESAQDIATLREELDLLRSEFELLRDDFNELKGLLE